MLARLGAGMIAPVQDLLARCFQWHGEGLLWHLCLCRHRDGHAGAALSI